MWHKDREFIDGQTGAHVQVLRNLETGAEHITQIMLGSEEEIDPKEKAAADLEMLNARHDRMMAYAAKHRIVIRGAK